MHKKHYNTYMKQFDERDTLFARMAWPPDSKAFRDYYERHPEKLAFDMHLRELGKKTKNIDPAKAKLVDSAFAFLADINHLSELKHETIAENKTKIEPNQISLFLKEYAKEYGANLVGIAKITPEYFYSHRGRKVESYGKPAIRNHKYALVFAVEMDKDKIDLAPAIEESIETSRIYVKTAMIGMVLTYYIRSLGYEARNHMDANYLLPLPALAEEAGLGEMGRIGFLVTKEFGPRIRLGAITTDLKLIADEKIDLGIRAFCETCHICENACLGHAISSDNSTEKEGRHFWQTQGEKCFEVWQRIGTDCGVCMKVCPLGKE